MWSPQALPANRRRWSVSDAQGWMRSVAGDRRRRRLRDPVSPFTSRPCSSEIADADKTVGAFTTRFAPGDTVYLSVVTAGAGSGTIGVRWSYYGHVVDEPKKKVSYQDIAATEFHLKTAAALPPGDYTVEAFLDSKSPARGRSKWRNPTDAGPLALIGRTVGGDDPCGDIPTAATWRSTFCRRWGEAAAGFRHLASDS